MGEIRAENRFVMDSLNIIMTTMYLHRLLGWDFGRNNIFYINRNIGEINIETILDEEIYNNFSLIPTALRGGRNKLSSTYIDWYIQNEWAAIHMSYDFPFTEYLLPGHLEKIDDYGNGKEFVLFHDIKFWNNLIWSKWDIEYVSVPAQSEKLVEVLQFLNKLQTREMSNIFRYGIPGEDHTLINEYEVELKNYPYYYRGLSPHMEYLVGEPKLIFNYFPRKVKEIYIDYVKNIGKDLFSDIDYDDYRNKAVMKLFKDNPELVEYFMTPVDWVDDLQKGLTYEQEHNELFTGYVKEDSLHYCYRVNREELEDRLVQEGKDLSRMLELFEKTHGDEKAYKNAFRVFTEHFRFEQECITLREPKELGGGSLQSPDDEEATFRTKSRESSRGYVANLTETCDDKNELQLINRVTVAPNTTDDQQLLAEDIENLKDREGIDEL